jgi:hypothetical protein
VNTAELTVQEAAERVMEYLRAGGYLHDAAAED